MPAETRAQVLLLSLRALAQDTPDAVALAALSDAERASVARAQAPQRRAETLHGRYALRRLLGLCLACAPERVVLIEGQGAKPRVAAAADGRAPPAFNVSHAGGLLALAIGSPGREIGVDIEVPDTRLSADIDAIAARHFAAAETAVVRRGPPALALAEFVRMWTLKEACLKAVGVGLSGRLDSVAVAQRLDVHAVALNGVALHAWHRELPARRAHVAVAWDGGAREPQWLDWTGRADALHHAAASVSPTS